MSLIKQIIRQRTRVAPLVKEAFSKAKVKLPNTKSVNFFKQF